MTPTESSVDASMKAGGLMPEIVAGGQAGEREWWFRFWLAVSGGTSVRVNSGTCAFFDERRIGGAG
jgi:hypothetical protein